MKKFILLSVVTSLIYSCSKDDDSLRLPNTVDPDGSAAVEVQDFMWKAMNFWYYWQPNVEDLADDRFVNTVAGRAEYTAFLDSEDSEFRPPTPIRSSLCGPLIRPAGSV